LPHPSLKRLVEFGALLAQAGVDKSEFEPFRALEPIR